MRELGARRLSSSWAVTVLSALAVAACTHLCATPTRAQAPHNDLDERNLNVTMAERNKDTTANREAAAKQMNEDFKGIQSLDVDIMKIFTAANPLDYKKISEDSAQIKIRAKRLKDYLTLPPGAKDEKRHALAVDADLKLSVPALKDSIKSFVGNPIFQQTPGQKVDYREVAKARRDLADIIDLSASVEKAAGKLKN